MSHLDKDRSIKDVGGGGLDTRVDVHERKQARNNSSRWKKRGILARLDGLVLS